MLVLGISYNFHDAAACLIKDGQVIAAVEEERFSRLKHDARYPQQAIAWCLAEGGIEPRDLACVAFYEKPARKLERVLQTAKHYSGADAELAPEQIIHYLTEGLRLEQVLRDKL